jgi:hypothetical protein
MTVRAILDTKGHEIISVKPDAKLSVAVKLLSNRRIGAGDRRPSHRRHPFGTRHRAGDRRTRRGSAPQEYQFRHSIQTIQPPAFLGI